MPESHFFVQIDTTFYRMQTRSHQRFQPFDPLFNRTLLMSSIHKVMGSIIGHVAAAPTLSHVGDKGTAKAFYQVIRNIRWNDQDTGERQERIVSIPLASWGKQAENDCQYLRKGSHVAVEFRIDNAQYEKDGETYYGFQFTVEAIEYLDSREDAERRLERRKEAMTG